MANVEGKATAITVLTPLRRHGPILLAIVFWAGRHLTFKASIARQFEFVQAQWLNDGNAFRLGDDQDVLLGPRDQEGVRKMTIPGSPPFFLGALSRLVTVRGGEYFFCPGPNGLRFLAALGSGE